MVMTLCVCVCKPLEQSCLRMQNIASAYIYLRPFFLLNMILYAQLRSVTGQEASCVKKTKQKHEIQRG